MLVFQAESVVQVAVESEKSPVFFFAVAVWYEASIRLLNFAAVRISQLVTWLIAAQAIHINHTVIMNPTHR